MIGLKFGVYHTFDRYGLVLTNMKISAPEVITKYVEIPGADRVLDLSEVFGAPKYKMRKAEFDFVLVPNEETLANRMTDLIKSIHGRFKKVTLDEDPDYYYECRCFVGNYEKNGEVVKVSVTADVQPYKLKNQLTTREGSMSGTTAFVLSNGSMPTHITVTVSGNNPVYVETPTGDVVCEAGRSTVIESLLLKKGDNAVTMSCGGTANVLIEYQEGEL